MIDGEQVIHPGTGHARCLRTSRHLHRVEMIRPVILLRFLLALFTSKAQNLIPNPSFEELISCPEYPGQLYLASDWFDCDVGNPDLFHPCAIDPDMRVPYNGFGYQQPAHGQGYMGMITWSAAGVPGLGLHEIIGTRLLSPLVPGTPYWLTMKVSWTSGYPNVSGLTGFASNNMGLRCAMDSLWWPGWWTPWPDEAQYHSTEIVTDSAGWTVLAGSFVADAAYRFVYIGNFFQDLLTEVLELDTAGDNFAYYYVDDLCLSPSPDQCPAAVGLVAQGKAMGVQAYFDASAQAISWRGAFTDGPFDIELFDVTGRLVLHTRVQASNGKVRVAVPACSTGLYVWRIWDGRALRSQQLLIQP